METSETTFKTAALDIATPALLRTYTSGLGLLSVMKNQNPTPIPRHSALVVCSMMTTGELFVSTEMIPVVKEVEDVKLHAADAFLVWASQK